MVKEQLLGIISLIFISFMRLLNYSLCQHNFRAIYRKRRKKKLNFAILPIFREVHLNDSPERNEVSDVQ